MTKIREILPDLDKAIIAMSRMSEHAATLEIMDNDQASRRLKRALSDFENVELATLKKKVNDIRDIINSRPKRKIKNSGRNIDKALAARATQLGKQDDLPKVTKNKDYDYDF